MTDRTPIIDYFESVDHPTKRRCKICSELIARQDAKNHLLGHDKKLFYFVFCFGCNTDHNGYEPYSKCPHCQGLDITTDEEVIEEWEA
jgi:hypothetical protein